VIDIYKLIVPSSLCRSDGDEDVGCSAVVVVVVCKSLTRALDQRENC
jgi:hypothetical protein